MNTTKIKWRLANRPTPNEVDMLFTSGLLTKEEAREILFSLETQEDRDVDALKSEIKFLRDLVQKLSGRSTIVETIRIVEKPYLQYPWYQPYAVWCVSGGNNAISGTAGAQYSTTTAIDSASNAIYMMNASSGTTDNITTTGYMSVENTEPFSDIKTF
jgi:hypothetical protein